MRSIRAQLLVWLLPGFVLVCAAGGVGVYLSVRKAFEADLDARLGRLAGSARLALRSQIVGSASGTRGLTLRTFLAREEFKTQGHYFEQWTPSGAVKEKSPNLSEVDLPRPTEFTRDAARYDCTLANADRVRVSAMRLTPSGTTPPVDFAVALSRLDEDARLSKLIVELVIGSIASCTVLSLILVLALRFAMRPLARLGDQAAVMGASSLHERFPTEAMPAEIAPIVTRLNHLIARLEKSFERERRFSGDLAHELHTSLAAIRSTSEVAAKWPEQSTPDDFVDIAQVAARLQQTMNSLLLLSRAETASADIVCELVTLRPLVEECVSLHAERARQREVSITLQLNETITMQTDARLLRIVVMNLIANAVEYTPPGTEVTIVCGSMDRQFEIVNPAPMLTAEDIPHLFERLWRKDAARSDSSHAGLGLSLARSCASALGLALTAELDTRGELRMLLRGGIIS